MALIQGLGALTAIAFATFGFLLLNESRHDTLDGRLRSDASLVRAVANDIARNFELFDLSLRGAITAWNSPEFAPATPAARQMMMFDFSTGATYLNRLLAIDERGDVVADSSTLEPPKVSMLDREYFQVHRDNPSPELFISRPVRSKFTPGVIAIVLSRRVNKADGSFGGVVAGAIDVSYFESLFNNLALRSDASFRVFQEDGTLILGHPFRLADIGSDQRGAALFEHFPDTSVGSFFSDGQAGGVPRYYSFSRVGNMPLVVSVGSSLSEIYGPWQTRAIRLGAILFLLTSAFFALAILLGVEFRRRGAAESQARQLAERLSLSASTDGLTGLANRRALDEFLANECARGYRARKALSVLMIDVDYFKKYNDALGHSAGDDALRLIAQCVDRHCRRPGDLAARYGGEEFVVVLPETSLMGALRIADMMQKALQASNTSHPAGLNGRLTMSIGAACGIIGPSEDPFSLVKCADAALYHAKDNGRDQTAVYDELQERRSARR